MTIKRRFVSVLLTIIISTLLLLVINRNNSHNNNNSINNNNNNDINNNDINNNDINNNKILIILNSLGIIWPKSYLFIQIIWDCISMPLILTSVLFMGPIGLYLTQLKGLLKFNYHYVKHSMNLIVVRNYIIAPITEEFIFRGVLSAILLNCWSLGWTITISSVMFGFAHSHHFLSQRYLNSDIRRVNAIAALEQMTYTTLFGMYASLLYLKTRFLLTPIIVHSYCNLMGLPDFESIFSSRFAICLTLIGFILWIFGLIYVYTSL